MGTEIFDNILYFVQLAILCKKCYNSEVTYFMLPLKSNFGGTVLQKIKGGTFSWRCNYGYGGIRMTKKGELYDKWKAAERRLSAYERAIHSPVGSRSFEGAVHSGESITDLRKKAEQARRDFLNYKSK